MWSWIGIAAAGWCVFSFAFAVLVGRAIRLADQTAQRPVVPQRPKYRSGLRITHDGEQVAAQAEASGHDAPPSASRSLDSY